MKQTFKDITRSPCSMTGLTLCILFRVANGVRCTQGDFKKLLQAVKPDPGFILAVLQAANPMAIHVICTQKICLMSLNELSHEIFLPYFSLRALY
jgi:hypothetical protein